MVKANKITKLDELGIKDKIYSIRGHQVMLDRDLAELYEVETRRLNEQVKRNKERFPEEFCFLLNNSEYTKWRSQFAMSNNLKIGLRWKPYAFTEQGVAMLSGVLKSKVAVRISISIIKTFVEMRKFISLNSLLFQRLENTETKLLEHDNKFDKVFNALETQEDIPKQRIFFDGQIFDAHKFVSDLFSSVKKSIVIIDNYIDVTIIAYLSQLPKNTKVKIFTKSISTKLKLDLEKFANQYFPVEVKIFKQSHDRFVIIDDKDVYHIGASLKDLGKKWFAFSKMDKAALDILNKIEDI